MSVLLHMNPRYLQTPENVYNNKLKYIFVIPVIIIDNYIRNSRTDSNS